MTIYPQNIIHQQCSPRFSYICRYCGSRCNGPYRNKTRLSIIFSWWCEHEETLMREGTKQKVKLEYLIISTVNQNFVSQKNPVIHKCLDSSLEMLKYRHFSKVNCFVILKLSKVNKIC